MKKLFFICLILILVIGLIFKFNNDYRRIISRLRDKSDIESNKLTYRIYLFGLLPVGEAVFDIPRQEQYNGKLTLHLSANAQPIKILSRMFYGFAVLDSYIDVDSHDPLFFRQKTVMQNKIIADKEVLYDQQNGVMTLGGIKRQILEHTQDPLSLTYNLRYMDFDKVKDFQMNINTNQKNYVFQANVENKELVINKNMHKLVMIKSTIRRRDKNPYHRSNVDMVLLKGKQNTPVLIKVFASGFYLNANLISTSE